MPVRGDALEVDVTPAWIPAERFLSVVDSDPDLMRRVTGTSFERRIRYLRSGGQQFISFSVADRILTSLDLHWWWHIPADEGGLADIYEDGAQYGAPTQVARWKPDPRRRYATEEERLEARRRSWRESKKRRSAA